MRYRLGQALTLGGRDFYLGPHGTKTSRLEYDRLVAEWLQHGRQLPPDDQEQYLSVVEMIVAYLHFAGTYYRKDGQPTSEYCRMYRSGRKDARFCHQVYDSWKRLKTDP
jgi:hypothetical protein